MLSHRKFLLTTASRWTNSLFVKMRGFFFRNGRNYSVGFHLKALEFRSLLVRITTIPMQVGRLGLRAEQPTVSDLKSCCAGAMYCAIRSDIVQ